MNTVITTLSLFKNILRLQLDYIFLASHVKYYSLYSLMLLKRKLNTICNFMFSCKFFFIMGLILTLICKLLFLIVMILDSTIFVLDE